MNKKGFTLIELLAVIIILGILMIIAIPSVTSYINDSRKSAYVDTAKEIISGARNLVNEGKLGMYDTGTSYYIPAKYVNTENSLKSPYGEFLDKSAYVGVIYDGKGYKYYWISSDDTGQGIDEVTPVDKLDTDKIKSDLNPNDILDKIKRTGIGNRTDIKILNAETGIWEPIHLDDTSNNVPEDGNSGVPVSNIVCIPATTLHTTTCQNTSTGCAAVYGTGSTITYGSIVNGNPKAGDAYDCDVNYDGIYDSLNERFYYLKNDGDKSLLIFYMNMNNQTTAYDLSGENWHGPRDAYQYLPNTSEWDHPGIIAPGTRQIVAENGERNVKDHAIESFSYTNKAARLVTSQEINSSCNITVGLYIPGELDGCSFLWEKIGKYEGNDGATGFYLETPRSSDNSTIWLTAIEPDSNYRFVANGTTYTTTYFGVRPVITIKTSDLG